MLLFTLEAIYMWDAKRMNGCSDAKLNNCLFDAYRDWRYTQESDGPAKERHHPCTRLYHVFPMHAHMGPGYTCMRSLRGHQAGSIENLWR